MVNTESEKPDEPTEAKIEPPDRAPERSGETMGQKILYTTIVFLITGVIGTLISAYIQQRGWSYQNSVNKIEKDTDQALNLQKNVNELIQERYHAAVRMFQAFASHTTVKELEAARDSYSSVKNNWDLHYPNLAAEIKFNFDDPFGIDMVNKEPIWSLSCTTYTLGGNDNAGVDTSSANAVLEVVNHCQDLANQDIELVNAGRKPVNDVAEAFNRRTEHIWRVNEVLRCMIIGRALEMRRKVAGASYWATLLGLSETGYYVRPAKEDACLREYRENPTFGLASLKRP
jgi:cell division protein FtsL